MTWRRVGCEAPVPALSAGGLLAAALRTRYVEFNITGLVARDCHDYYGSSATPRRPQRTVRLPRAHQPGSAGTARALPTFTHMPVSRVGAQLYPGDIATRHRNTARGLPRPTNNRAGETAPNRNKSRASQQPIAASFGAAVLYRGFDHWYRFPYAFLPCLRTRPAGGGPFLRC